MILETLKSKQDEILRSILRLILSLIAKSETFAQKIAQNNDYEAVKSLLSIMLGPGLQLIQFSTEVKSYVIVILRQLIKFNSDLK